MGCIFVWCCIVSMFSHNHFLQKHDFWGLERWPRFNSQHPHGGSTICNDLTLLAFADTARTQHTDIHSDKPQYTWNKQCEKHDFFLTSPFPSYRYILISLPSVIILSIQEHWRFGSLPEPLCVCATFSNSCIRVFFFLRLLGDRMGISKDIHFRCSVYTVKRTNFKCDWEVVTVYGQTRSYYQCPTCFFWGVGVQSFFHYHIGIRNQSIIKIVDRSTLTKRPQSKPGLVRFTETVQ